MPTPGRPDEPMDDSGYPADVTRRANDLYWGSDSSVNQIAADLDLSKSALYGLIEPLPAGYPCPACGGETGYANRTAMQRDWVMCAECDWEGVGDEDGVDAREGSEARHGARGGAGRTNGRPSGAHASSGLSRMLIGGALLGAAAGIALVALARRDR